MVKKGAGGKGKAKSKSAGTGKNVVEVPPEHEMMPLLYRKASFDFAAADEDKNEMQLKLRGLLRVRSEKNYIATVPHYFEFLRAKGFYFSGDEIPEGVTPKPPAPKKNKAPPKKKK